MYLYIICIVFLAGNIVNIPCCKCIKLLVVNIGFIKSNDRVIGQIFYVFVKLLVCKADAVYVLKEAMLVSAFKRVCTIIPPLLLPSFRLRPAGSNMALNKDNVLLSRIYNPFMASFFIRVSEIVCLIRGI